jgi:hypothetical protein
MAGSFGPWSLAVAVVVAVQTFPPLLVVVVAVV